jgi:hypothetical protein
MISSTVFYHRTRPQAAEEIIKNGFRDGTGAYLTGDIHSGVWLSDVPLTADYGISVCGKDDVILRVTLPCRLEDLAEYEWVEEIEDPDTGQLVNPKRYREWLVPAEMIGAKMRKSVMPAFMSS